MALLLCLDSFAYGTRRTGRSGRQTFKKGNSQELNGYLSDKVELILESRSINVDNQAAEKKMASFFSGNRVSGFTVNHQGKRNESSFIVGTLTTANGNFRVN